MSRRWPVLLIFVAILLAIAASPAYAAYGPLWSHDAGAGAVLCADTSGATAVWVSSGPGGSAVLAQRFSRDGEPRTASPQTLVDGIAGLTDWLAVADRFSGVAVAWKAGGVTYVQGFDVDGGAAYAPVAVCSDAQVAALRGAGATAVPLQLVADTQSGVFVRLGISPSSAAGDTLLAHVSGTGVSAVPDPGLAVAAGTVGAMAADDQGRLVALLGAPGRSGVAVQRFGPDLSTDWPTPVSPYNPLVEQPPATAQEPLALVAGGSAVAAWREGTKVKVQRYTLEGDRAWLRPVAVTAPGDVRLTGDSFSGCYVVDTTTDGVRVRHVTLGGTLLGGGAGSVEALGLTDPLLGGAAVNGAGDLDVTYADAGAATTSGAVRFTYLGTATAQPVAPATGQPAAVASDRVGGVYTLAGDLTGSVLGRLGETGLGVTIRPRAMLIRYGNAVSFAGYLSDGGVPLAAQRLQLRWMRAGSTTPRTPVSTLTDSRGFYNLTAMPSANGTWEAVAPDATGGPVVSEAVKVEVAPAVGLALTHTGPRAHPIEVFTGTVKPSHAGAKVLLQRRSGSSWRTITSDRLDSGSRFRILWTLPRKTATYTLRVILPAHADHARGVSPLATLRVRFGANPQVVD
jgi:hypothetical protein